MDGKERGVMERKAGRRPTGGKEGGGHGKKVDGVKEISLCSGCEPMRTLSPTQGPEPTEMGSTITGKNLSRHTGRSGSALNMLPAKFHDVTAARRRDTHTRLLPL